MRSRQLRKKIEVWQTASVSDGFGGFTVSTVSETLISTQWANISTIQAGRVNNVEKVLTGEFSKADLGLIDPSRTILVTVRKNVVDYDIETMFIKYRTKKYTINWAPINMNFDDSMLIFAATEETVKSNVTP